MRNRPSRLVIPLALALLTPALAAAQKLDKDDKAWLDEVRPILLPDEEKLYKGLKDKNDRLEFRKIFWARRDPDLATPDNEFEAEFRKARAEADQTYRVPGRVGAETDCGRTYVLLGKPTEVRQESTGEVGLRTPETWTYRGESFQGGQAVVSFDAECRAPAGFSAQLDRVAATRIVHPTIDYRKGKDGHIVKLADQLPRDTAARRLLNEPRQDFPLAAQVSYLKVADGSTAVLGLVRGDAQGVSTSGSGDSRTAELSVAASALAEDGKEAGWIEHTLKVPVDAAGTFEASFKLGLKPGKYSLRSVVVDVKGGKASLATSPIEVPDLAQVEVAGDGTTTAMPSTSSLMVLKRIEQLPGGNGNPDDPLAAFELGGFRLVPLFEGRTHKADQIELFYQIYDLAVDPATSKANASAVVSILKDGKKPVAQAPPNAIETAFAGSSVGPIPLANFEPGQYVVRLKVTDRVGKKDLQVESPLEILP